MRKINYILSYWFKIKLKRYNSSKKESFHPTISNEDNLMIIKLYEEYEERKRLKKIKFSLLFKDDFLETKTEELILTE